MRLREERLADELAQVGRPASWQCSACDPCSHSLETCWWCRRARRVPTGPSASRSPSQAQAGVEAMRRLHQTSQTQVMTMQSRSEEEQVLGRSDKVAGGLGSVSYSEA